MKFTFPELNPCKEDSTSNRTWFFLIVYIILVMALLTYPPSSNEMTFSQPNAHGVNFRYLDCQIIASFFLVLYLVAYLGYALLFPFHMDVKVAWAVKLVGSFFAGYLASIGIIRILSLFFPYKGIFLPVILTISAVICILMPRHWREAGKVKLVLGKILKGMGLNLVFLFALLLVFGCALIYQMHTNQYFWVGHGPWYYPAFLEGLEQEKLLHFPIIKGHYDEIIFTYFLVNPFDVNFPTTVPMWLTLGLNKISLGCFLYILMKKLEFDRLPAAAFSVFFMIGTTSILPTRYYLLYDASNPIWMTAHSGRIVGIGICLLLILGFYLHEWKKLPLLFYILIGLGLSATSISNSAWSLFILMISIAISILVSLSRNQFPVDNSALSPPQDNPARWVKKYLSLAILAALTSVFLIFVHSYTNRASYYIKLLLSVFPLIFLALAFLPLRVAFRRVKEVFGTAVFAHGHLARLAIFLVSTLIGLIFLGNVSSNDHIHDRIFKDEVEIRSIQSYPIHSTSMALNDFRINKDRHPSEHKSHQFEWEREVGYFFAYFGLVFLMWIFSYVALEHHLDPASPQVEKSYLFILFAVLMALVPAIFFFISFTNFVSPVGWLKSRFLELPMYTLLFIFLAITKSFSPKFIRFTATTLAIYSIVPFIATERALQIFENAKVLLNLLQG